MNRYRKYNNKPKTTSNPMKKKWYQTTAFKVIAVIVVIAGIGFAFKDKIKAAIDKMKNPTKTV